MVNDKGLYRTGTLTLLTTQRRCYYFLFAVDVDPRFSKKNYKIVSSKNNNLALNSMENKMMRVVKRSSL